MSIRTKPLQAISERQISIDPKFINLEAYYNFSVNEEIHGKPGNTIPLISGLADYNGVGFDVRGIIQLASSLSFEKSHIEYPTSIVGIPVNQLASELSFLHSSAWESKLGTDIVCIVVNYVNGQKQSITLKYQIEVEDWWFHLENSVFPAKAHLAWEGSNERVKDLGFVLKLYRYNWENPMPDVEIKTIDLISSMNDTGYMLYGITCM